MSIFDFFTREAGQERRRALEGLLTQFIPPEMRPQLSLLAEANPVVSMERAGQDAQTLFAPDQSLMDRLAAGGRMASNMAGVVAPMVAASKGAVPAVQAAEDALMGWSAASPMAFAARDFMTDEFGGVGFRAYQGSPHDFNAERLVRMPDGLEQYIVGRPDVLPDVPAGATVLRDYPLGRMRMDKIGTGEGAQAYGHGIYAAENEGVAQAYKGVQGMASADPMPNVASKQLAAYGDTQKMREFMRLVFPSATDDQIEAAIVTAKNPPPGRMYEVQINADPNDFLDWDKPLSEQPDIAKRLGYSFRTDDEIHTEAEKLFAEYGQYPDMPPQAKARLEELQNELDRRVPNMTGEQLYTGRTDNDYLHSVLSGNKFSPEQSEALRAKGIPGIKYLDAGSRGAGDGSRNYVVFDENLIEIVRKYGIAGAAAMLGMSQADVAQAMQQQPQPQGLLTGPQ